MKLKPQIPRFNSNFTFADKNTTVYIGINVNRVSGVDENREVTNYSYIISFLLSQYRFTYFLKNFLYKFCITQQRKRKLYITLFSRFRSK